MADYKTSSEIKSLLTQISKLEADISVLSSEVSDRQTQLSVMKNKLTDKKKQYNDLLESKTGKDPIVSEHAILRYLERVNGIDMKLIVNEIMDEKTKSTIKFMKNGKINRDTYTVVVKNSIVVSIT